MKNEQPNSLPVPVTVILLTLNEEFHLPGVLANVKNWAEDVFIVDSLSTDRTVDIALEYGVKVVQRPFANYSDQWNWAIDRLPIKTPWVLKVDADERVSAELKDEIRFVVAQEPKENAFVIPVRLWFMGKRMNPRVNVVRFWRHGKAHFSGVVVNEHLMADGLIGRLRCCIEHHDSPDLHHWMEKQNRYTTMRAIENVKGLKLSAEPKLFGTALERRIFFIRLFFRIPFRYQFQWFHEVFGRGAWRAGKTGLEWAQLRIMVRRLCEFKEKEMRITGRVPQIPTAAHGDYDIRVLNSSLQRLVSSNENT